MKKIFPVAILCFFIFESYAQDIIYTKNKDKIEAKISEVTSESIKYKPLDFMDGPIRNIPLYEVYMIKFENGTEEFFEKERPTVEKERTTVHNKERFYSNKKNLYYISIATGIGQSYGGIGLRFQGRTGNIVGFGYHAGVGYFPELNNLKQAIWWSIGCKFFWYKAWYLDFQFGSVAQYRVSGKYGTAYGPSILIGGDWFFNKYVGLNGAIGGAFNLTEPGIKIPFLTFDFGFVVKF